MTTHSGCTYWYEVSMHVDAVGDGYRVSTRVRIPAVCISANTEESIIKYLNPASATFEMITVNNGQLFDSPLAQEAALLLDLDRLRTELGAKDSLIDTLERTVKQLNGDKTEAKEPEKKVARRAANTRTIREYKKHYMICEDSEGKIIYAGDTVELYNGTEIRSAWTSRVYWNMIDGAYVDTHPSHAKIGIGKYRELRGFLNQDPVRIPDHEGNMQVLKIYCKKIKSFYD